MNFKSFLCINWYVSAWFVFRICPWFLYTKSIVLIIFWFYLSVPLFVIASLLIIYGALFLKDNKNE